jgi:hypothetical protein
MVDFFSNSARVVLGLGVDVQPRLPPRFAPWPGLPPANGLAGPPAAVGESASLVGVLPPPLIDPADPAAGAPLPTFQQMSQLRPASGPPVQPSQPAAQDRPETADFEQADIRQAVATPIPPAVDDAPPSAPPTAPASSPTSPAAADEPPTPPVIQVEADSDTDGAVTASPAPTGASGDRPPKEVATTERDQAVPPPPSPAPRPAAGQERSTSSARLPDSPANIGRLLRSSQAEPVESEAVEAQPEPVEGGRAEPVKGQPKLVEARSEPVKWQPEPVEGHAEPVKGQLELVEGQPELVEGHAEPVKVRRTDLLMQPLARAPASAPLTVQPAAPVRAPVVQRQQAAPGGQPVAPPAPQPVPAAEPDLPVSTQARAIPTTAAPDLTTGSLEPALPAGRAVPGWGEPSIVPAPEPAPGEMGPTPRADAVAILQPPSARPEIGQPEPVPTVRVTIGRVVVRAAPAAERPPSRRVELPRPPLSLEEYLQGRQGGTR